MRLQTEVATGFVCLWIALFAGCQGATEEPTGSSSVWIPLLQPGPDGVVYRLRDATFHVTGPGGVDLIVVGGDDDSGVSVTLAPGQHSIELLDGWSLERSDDGGAFEPVPDVVLASENPDVLRVYPNRSQTVVFQFILRRTTTDVLITFGVVENPRQLGGAIRWVGGRADHAAYFGTVVDFTIFFAPFSQMRFTRDDGTRVLYTDSIVNAVEFYNDGPGLLGPLAASLTGGILTFEVGASPDQVGVADPTGDFSGDHSSSALPSVNLSFPAGGLVLLFALDAEGFPADGSFFVTSQTIELLVDGEVVLTGRSQGLRHFIE